MRKVCRGVGLALALCWTLLAGTALADEIEGGSSLETAEEIGWAASYFDTLENGEPEWLMFTANSEPMYYRVDYKNEEVDDWVSMDLYDDQGLCLMERDVWKGESEFISFKAQPGAAYYLKFYTHASDRTGRYSIALSHYPDTDADERGGATAIALDQTRISSIDGTGDVDWLCFDTEAGCNFYRVDFKNEDIEAGLGVELFDENGLSLNIAERAISSIGKRKRKRRIT